MRSQTIEREPLVRTAADRPERSADACNCRSRALGALGELADLTLALGIHDADVWRGIGALHAILTAEHPPRHAHRLGDVH